MPNMRIFDIDDLVAFIIAIMGKDAHRFNVTKFQIFCNKTTKNRIKSKVLLKPQEGELLDG